MKTIPKTSPVPNVANEVLNLTVESEKPVIELEQGIASKRELESELEARLERIRGVVDPSDETVIERAVIGELVAQRRLELCRAQRRDDQSRLDDARRNRAYDVDRDSRRLAPILSALAEQRRAERLKNLYAAFPNEDGGQLQYRLESHPDSEAEAKFIRFVSTGLTPNDTVKLCNLLLSGADPFAMTFEISSAPVHLTTIANAA